ncbi:MAG TPA: SRPBCC domain-containing protein [Bradyrhizobium sp.]|jgi:uncharacterized protein YndB with AHSA1/START domain|uniref:SRPBCC family protein n=1 Tax=Bradyrhizobium sp. TaxID=376 RepID=UPI002CFFD0CC|nr:SRPBCC domain-containing protein [Bradyrhizobium sp.]HTB00797.1 SRPBCC domain-containing protein [Bradyrhizobium sp.]
MAVTSNTAGHVRQPSLTLKRRLNASPAKVYAAWTSPQKIARWFGPAQVKAGTEQAVIDPCVGGRYRISFDMENGEHCEIGGVYREVVPDRLLVFSWAWHTTPERESQVTVSLQPDGDGTLLTLHHEAFFDQAARDGHERGWNGALDKLKKFVG